MIKTSSTTAYGAGLFFPIERAGRPRPADVSVRVPTINGNRQRWMRLGGRPESLLEGIGESACLVRSPAGLICTIVTHAILE